MRENPGNYKVDINGPMSPRTLLRFCTKSGQENFIACMWAHYTVWIIRAALYWWIIMDERLGVLHTIFLREGNRNPAQGFTQARQAFYHWAGPLAPWCFQKLSFRQHELCQVLLWWPQFLLIFIALYFQNIAQTLTHSKFLKHRIYTCRYDGFPFPK